MPIIDQHSNHPRQAQKNMERIEDWKRIAHGEISPMEYQLRYSLVPIDFCQKAKISNLKEMIAQGRKWMRQNHRRQR